MKESHLKIALTICIVAILALVFVNYVDLSKNDSQHPVNDGLTSLRDFNVDCPEVGTSTNGTFFIMQSKDSVNIMITSSLNVGEKDVHGIGFKIPKELDIVSVLCSFKGDVSTKYVYTGPIPGGGQEVGIAWAGINGQPSGGGRGMMIMELQLSGSAKLSEIDSLVVSIYLGGYSNMIDWVVEEITIPIRH